jgi:polysaccharide biosynthesis/export protein
MRFTYPMKAVGFTLFQTISKSQPFGLMLFLLSFALVLFLAPALCIRVVAQQNAALAPVSRVDGANTLADDNRYRIGPGDVLSIVVRKASELSGSVRVDQRGMIRIPMIDGEVRAACLTEGELATKITTLYLEYKQNPYVDVFVTDFQSRPVAITGAINSPGQFRLQRRVRLLELLSFAGGPSSAAGRAINIIHTGEPNVCEADASDRKTGDVLTAVDVYKLFDTLKGKEEANPFVQPGDIIRIPEADQVFVIGHVNSPGPITLRDRRITISKAIAMAGGPARDGKTSRISIIRQTSDSDTKQEILVNLNAIAKEKAEDIVLLPNDIVQVGLSPGKTILAILTGAVPTVVSQGVVRAIP